MNPEGAEKPCPFQHCCKNFSPGKNGNCVAEFDDVLECWVDTNPSQEALEKGWAGTPM